MAIAADRVRLKRAYETPAADDGTRVLVERLWPRGISKAEAALDDWMRDIAPSPELRKWYGHDVARWDEFRDRYRSELGAHADEVEALRRIARKGPLTLVFAARDAEHSSAAVLRELLIGG
jgi:uncharacterized protein YeaO (DUF488 family)